MSRTASTPWVYGICEPSLKSFWKRWTAMKQELKERLAPLGPIRDIDRVSSGSPADVVLRPAETMASVNTIDATLALARRHMTLLDAKTAIERMVEQGEATAHVPKVEDMERLIGDLWTAGVKATAVSDVGVGQSVSSAHAK